MPIKTQFRSFPLKEPESQQSGFRTQTRILDRLEVVNHNTNATKLNEPLSEQFIGLYQSDVEGCETFNCLIQSVTAFISFLNVAGKGYIYKDMFELHLYHGEIWNSVQTSPADVTARLDQETIDAAHSCCFPGIRVASGAHYLLRFGAFFPSYRLERLQKFLESSCGISKGSDPTLVAVYRSNLSGFSPRNTLCRFTTN